MLRLALVALLATSACRLSLEDDGIAPPPDGGRACMVSTENDQCLEADMDMAASQKLSWIEPNIFNRNCGSTSCHSPTAGGGAPGGTIVLTTESHDKLVNVDTTLAAGRKHVVPGNVAQSYLMVVLRHLPLAEADPPAPEPRNGLYMPQNTPPICCQKLDAIARWIEAGALND